MMKTAQAPHYTEITSELDVPVDEGRKAMHDLFSPDFPGWSFPNTDLIASFSPFNNLPTQYRMTIDGQQMSKNGELTKIMLLRLLTEFYVQFEEQNTVFNLPQTSEVLKRRSP